MRLLEIQGSFALLWSEDFKCQVAILEMKLESLHPRVKTRLRGAIQTPEFMCKPVCRCSHQQLKENRTQISKGNDIERHFENVHPVCEDHVLQGVLMTVLHSETESIY